MINHHNRHEIDKQSKFWTSCDRWIIPIDGSNFSIVQGNIWANDERWSKIQGELTIYYRRLLASAFLSSGSRSRVVGAILVCVASEGQWNLSKLEHELGPKAKWWSIGWARNEPSWTQSDRWNLHQRINRKKIWYIDRLWTRWMVRLYLVPRLDNYVKLCCVTNTIVKLSRALSNLGC